MSQTFVSNNGRNTSLSEKETDEALVLFRAWILHSFKKGLDQREKM